MRQLIIAATIAAALHGGALLAAPPPELEPFSFLLGEWTSSGTGQPGDSTGVAAFTRELQDRVIVRRSYAEYPGTPGKGKSRHDDYLILYASAGAGVRADYWDNEGHVIRYAVLSPGPGRAVFVSDASSGEPRFRLSYRLEATGVLGGEFAIAPPGAPDAFKAYLTWQSVAAAGRVK